MARQANVKQQEARQSSATSIEEVAALDYANNMFSEGHNRTAEIKKSARGYDEAAHSGDVENGALYGEAPNADTLLGAIPDTTRSREGTEAAGRDDESGGFLGGATDEVDSLEASAAPVDRTPRMQE